MLLALCCESLLPISNPLRRQTDLRCIASCSVMLRCAAKCGCLTQFCGHTRVRSDDRAVTDASIAEETVRIKRNDRPYRKQRETPHGDPTNVHPHKKLSWQRPTSFTEVTFWAATFAQGHHSWNKPITSAKTSYECDSLGLRFNADLLEPLEIFMLRAVPSFLPVFPIFPTVPVFLCRQTLVMSSTHRLILSWSLENLSVLLELQLHTAAHGALLNSSTSFPRPSIHFPSPWPSSICTLRRTHRRCHYVGAKS